jgi:hypothetical protein
VKSLSPDHAFSARVGRHIEAASIFDNAIGASTTARLVVAAQCEISPADLARICDPTTGRAVPLEHVLGLPDDAYRVVVDKLAQRAGLALVDMPKAGEMGDDFRAIAAAQRESADVVARGLDALADGRMCAREGAELAAECDEAIAALLAIRERARLAQREGVIGLVRKVGAA